MIFSSVQAIQRSSSRQRLGEVLVKSFSSAATTFKIPTEFKTFLIDAPSQEIAATKDELLGFHQLMYKMRRMEITCDQEYKSRNIRGFCHLYDGQEAIAVGIEAALTRKDDWITTYRCHGVALCRGSKVQQIFEELFGFEGGVVKGKGGSMHLYNKKSNFYGGAAIVGAQVPVGTGLAFYHKYKKDLAQKAGTWKEGQLMNVAIAAYGDGTANQGQVWEAANMAKLWSLPVIYLCENNMYGMGTSVQRSSAQVEYFKQGQGVIPGIQVDGMDVLAVKKAISFAKDYAASGKGPMIVEVKTYRYHGHSMSDPGISYRTRDEVSDMRKSRDPIEQIKKRIIDAGFSSDAELKEVEKDIRNEVQEALTEAKKGKEMEWKEMLTDIYAAEQSAPCDEPKWGDRLKSDITYEIRMPDHANTIYGNVQ